MSSEPRGWTCGGFTPPGLKSDLEAERPMVLRPGKFAAFARTATYPNLDAEAFPGVRRRIDAKSDPVAFAGFLHTKPFTLVVELVSATQKSCRGAGLVADTTMMIPMTIMHHNIKEEEEEEKE